MSARPLVIAGASRSGTSVLAQMMGLHPDVRGLKEIHFFEQHWTPETDGPLMKGDAVKLTDRLLHHALDGFYRPYQLNARAEQANRLVDSLSVPATACDVYRSVLDECAEGSAWVVDKTPRYVHWIPDILQALPEAIVAVITRDPRDVLLSQKRWYRTLWKARSEVTYRIMVRHMVQYHPATMSLLWRSAARAGERARHDPRVIPIRLEDLVADPERAIDPLLGAMGLDFDRSMLKVRRSGSSNRPGVRAGSGFDPTVLGRWRTGLSPTELWVSQTVCRELMPVYGYRRLPARPTALGMLWLIASWPMRTLATVCMNAGRSRTS